MTTQKSERIPEWTPGDRLRKARTSIGKTTRDFADLIGVSQKTVTDYENDRPAKPRKIVLNAWALATGVPVSWLERGVADQGDHDPHGPDGGETVRATHRNCERVAAVLENWITSGKIAATKLGDGRTSAYVITREELDRLKAGASS